MNPLKKWSWRPGRPAIGLSPTIGGAIFFVGTTLIGLTAVDADVNLLLMLFGLSIGAFLINFLFGWRSLRFITVRRVAPEAAVVGQQFDLRYVVTNRHRWVTARAIVIEDEAIARMSIENPQAFVTQLAPGETKTVSVPYLCDHRGRLRFRSVKVMSGFPFNLLMKWRRITVEKDMVIYPALGSLRADPRGMTRSLDIAANASTLGRSRGEEEYFGIREYRHGDSPRKIHWRRSARTGQLMIRETAAATSHQYWCVVDSRVVGNDKEAKLDLERTLTAAATFVCAVLEQGASIGLVCNGDPLVILPPGSGRSHRPRLLRELALREGDHDDALGDHVRGHPWPSRWHGPCLLFANVEDKRTEDAANALEMAIGPVRVITPNSPVFRSFIQLPASIAPPQTTAPTGDNGDKRSAHAEVIPA